MSDSISVNLVICARSSVPAYLRRRGPFDHVLSIADSSAVAAAASDPASPSTMAVSAVDAWHTMLKGECSHVLSLQFDDSADMEAPTSPKQQHISSIREFAQVVKQQYCDKVAREPGYSPNVLVHCNGGISRSPACALIMLHALGDTPLEALRHVKSVQPACKPNEHILALANISFTPAEMQEVTCRSNTSSTSSRSNSSSNSRSNTPVNNNQARRLGRSSMQSLASLRIPTTPVTVAVTAATVYPGSASRESPYMSSPMDWRNTPSLLSPSPSARIHTLSTTSVVSPASVSLGLFVDVNLVSTSHQQQQQQEQQKEQLKGESTDSPIPMHSHLYPLQFPLTSPVVGLPTSQLPHPVARTMPRVTVSSIVPPTPTSSVRSLTVSCQPTPEPTCDPCSSALPTCLPA